MRFYTSAKAHPFCDLGSTRARRVLHREALGNWRIQKTQTFEPSFSALNYSDLCSGVILP